MTTSPARLPALRDEAGDLLAEPAALTGAPIGYARVSTRDQLLDRQLAALNAAGCIRIFADKKSGKNAEREELGKALDYLRPGDTLVVESLDRLGRSLQDLIAIVSGLRKDGAGFRSLKESIDTTTPGGRLVFHVFAALAEFIRELIVEGTLEGLDAARARGQRLGRPPAMTPEQVRHARALLAQPAASIASIARLLGVSRSTLYKYVPELKEGSDARAIEADGDEPAAGDGRHGMTSRTSRIRRTGERHTTPPESEHREEPHEGNPAMASTTAPKKRKPETYTTEEMTALLSEWARVVGSYSMYAAMHLLTYTELPGRRDFAKHVDITTGYAADETEPLIAVVRDWDKLLNSGTVYLTGGDARMVEIAASYAAGRPVDLREHGNGLGTAHARRLVEAVAIGAGMGEFLTISDSSALAEMRAKNNALSGVTRTAD